MSSTSTPPSKNPARLLAKFARRASGVVLVLITVAVVGAMLVPALLGYDLYAVDGGSMEPTIQRGALAYASEVPVAELKVRDVITYVPPGHSRPVTHRIVDVLRPDAGGLPIYRTKGDANPRPDMRVFRLDRPTQARLSFSIPVVGWVLILLGNPIVKVLALGLPALLIALWMIGSLWQEGGRVMREREEAARERGALDDEDEELAGVAGARA